jgi:two-component sensor histidine kinase
MTDLIHILLVDDTPQNLDALESLLNDPEYRLIRALNVNQALEAVIEYELAAIVLDVQMPEMSGLELARLIKKRKKTQHIPILFLTAYYAEAEDILKGYDAGAVDYLTKPVNPLILKSKIRVFADLFRMSHALAANRALEAELAERRQTEAAMNRSLAEKEVLLKEIHHRVKNNLQVVSSILQMQGRAIEDPHYRAIFGECQDRVRTMALVHEKLYRSPNLAFIDLGEQVRELAEMLGHSYGRPGICMTVEVEATVVDIAIAVPVGLLLNELVSNALKHAFPEGRTGNVTVRLTRPSPDHLRLSVRDDGRGLPAEFQWQQAKSLGLTMLGALARQLRAKVEVKSERGTEFVLTFSAPAPVSACLESTSTASVCHV